MLLIPAIGIKNGQCVHLRRRQAHDAKLFDDDPAAVAQRWIDKGADRLHVIDLDGVQAGYPINDRVLGSIVDSAGSIPVQAGGGIRDEAAIETYLERGVEYVVIGTRAVSEPHFVADAAIEFPRRVIVRLDARNGMVATDGWSKLCNHPVIDLAQQFEQDGVFAIIHADISRDGETSGLNVEASRALAAELTIPVITAGGVTDMTDIDALLTAEEDGVAGAIIDHAIYDGTLDLAAARQHVDERRSAERSHSNKAEPTAR